MSLELSIFCPVRFLRRRKSRNIFFYLGQKGQPQTDPCGHVDLRQRNKNVRFRNYKNFAELFNLQVTRKEIYCKTFRITLSTKNVVECLLRQALKLNSLILESHTVLRMRPSPMYLPSSLSTELNVSNAMHSQRGNRKL